MKISELIQKPEGRRLEFKQELPTASDLAKTIVAFANDAGGDLYPEVEFYWYERGRQFQVQFIKTNYQPKEVQDVDIEFIGKELGVRLGLSWDQVGTKLKICWLLPKL